VSPRERGRERGFRESTQLNIFKHTQHVQKSRPALGVREREQDRRRDRDREKEKQQNAQVLLC
jgi:hypothetical protein